MLGLNQPLLINILGHAAGALIFAIFLVLLYSGRGWSGMQGRYLSGLAAGLSLAWNLGSLVVLAWPALPAPVLDLVVAMSFSMLSLLPAVLLQVSLEGAWPALVGAGYALSTAAVIMHFWEIQGNGATLHQTALLVITVGFLILAVVAVAAPALRKRRGGIRILASMCLALFAMSFVHFGNGHASQAWSSELVVHHAGIPLALFVLLQDYRFVLLDAFVRFLTNALLAAILTGLVIAAAFRLVLVERIAQPPLHEALLLISICLFLVFFAWLRNRVQAWLTHAIFRRGSVAGLASRVKDCPAFSSEDQYMDWAAALIAAAVKTKDYAVVAQSELAAAADLHAPVLANLLPASRSSPKWNWAEVVVPVRRGQDDVQLILLGRRHGGQRYFSEDLDTLRRTGNGNRRAGGSAAAAGDEPIGQPGRTARSAIADQSSLPVQRPQYAIRNHSPGSRRSAAHGDQSGGDLPVLSAIGQDLRAARAGDADCARVPGGGATEAGRSLDGGVPRG